MSDVINDSRMLSAGEPYNQKLGSEDFAAGESDNEVERLDQVPETPFEDPQEFQLINQNEVERQLGNVVKLELKYAILSGT